jgi:hypothetical protein
VAPDYGFFGKGCLKLLLRKTRIEQIFSQHKLSCKEDINFTLITRYYSKGFQAKSLFWCRRRYKFMSPALERRTTDPFKLFVRHPYCFNPNTANIHYILSVNYSSSSVEQQNPNTRNFSSISQPTMSYISAVTSVTHNPYLRLLNGLRSNKKPVMSFLGLPSFRTAQVIAQTGVDVSIIHSPSVISRLIIIKGIIIDCEHGYISDDSMHSSTAAIASMGVSPLVRLRMGQSDLIKRALDAGAQ